MVKFLHIYPFRVYQLKLFFFLMPAGLLFLPKSSLSTHIVGGELGYTCLGNNNYEVTLKVYRDCFNGLAAYDDPTSVFIYNNSTGFYIVLPIPFPGATQLSNNTGNPCLIIPPNICVEEAVFTYEVYLPPIPEGYTLVYQRCCRNISIVNIVNPEVTGATYEATMADSSLAICNSSPFFVNFPPTLICVNEPFIFDHSAMDPDGDSLVYVLCNPYDGADDFVPYPYPPVPYTNVVFVPPYSATNPMGGAPPMQIDPVTGLLTVTPTDAGQYVVGVCVEEYRNGNLLSIHRRDFQFNVTTCASATASINGGTNSILSPAVFNSCDGFTFYFPNNSTNATTYLWDFGVPSLTDDTSTAAIPVFTFPDTGLYNLTLIVNPGSACGDTAYGIVYVYPVLDANIMFPNGCTTDSLLFTDQSIASVGDINNWFWTFGDGTSALEQNPIHAYDTIGSFFVELVVGTDLGCLDTVSGVITINEKPEAFADPDTLICHLDTIQLTGSGLGNYQWSPAYALSSDTLQSPLASPEVTTSYTLTVTNQWGCEDTAVVLIDVYDNLEAVAGPDTVICPGGLVQLNGSGAVYFNWTPSAGLSDPNISNPIAAPGASTLYMMTTFISSCIDSDSVYIQVNPFPEISAGIDQAICIGDSIMITACCGTSYSWDPPETLSDPASENPVAFPQATTVYHLTASDSTGCPLILEDSLTVTVFDPPPLITTPDTIIYLGTSAQLYSIGAEYYQWLPAAWLNDVSIFNPISTPLQTITYKINALSVEGCPLSDSTKVSVIEDPLVDFPNAFTPNGDGLNDYFQPVVLGIFNAESFKVFNRWGEMVFVTHDLAKGWDGRHKGKDEKMGTYVYVLSGKSGTTDKAYFVKGNVVLLR
jgi:gliding motility-associated-like protein